MKAKLQIRKTPIDDLAESWTLSLSIKITRAELNTRRGKSKLDEAIAVSRYYCMWTGTQPTLEETSNGLIWEWENTRDPYDINNTGDDHPVTLRWQVECLTRLVREIRLNERLGAKRSPLTFSPIPF